MFPIPLKSLTDQQRHDYILKTFVLNQTEKSRRFKRDIDVIKEHHRFLYDADDDAPPDSWESRLARRYYDKLFKEYCIADLTRYKDNKVAMRWRTEPEVVAGTGQFQCGSRKCDQREGLRTWEVNFAYLEQGVRKNALVKLRLCTDHSNQLNFTSRKREVKRMKRLERRQTKDAKRRSRKGEDVKAVTDKVDEVGVSDNEEEQETVQDSIVTREDSPTAEDENEVSPEPQYTENVWSKKPEVEAETTTRESNFEKYLEDLLL